ncbi:MAG: division/cell wall cluster transcriptional repressor MraZ, partial [Lachnospiraceae bacterium]
KLKELPLTDPNSRTFIHFYVGGASSCEFDKQGRVLVPGTLREFAGLQKDAVLVGNINRIEVWSKDKWTETCNFDAIDDIAKSMQDMGIVI